MEFMDAEKYIAERLDPEIMWYDKRSAGNKTRLMCTEIAIIASTAAVPVIILFDNVTARVVAAALGALAAVLSSTLALFRYREHWTRYRRTTATLRHEKYLYLTRSAPYDSDDAFSILVARVEHLISQEHSDWIQVENTNPKSAAADIKDESGATK